MRLCIFVSLCLYKLNLWFDTSLTSDPCITLYLSHTHCLWIQQDSCSWRHSGHQCRHLHCDRGLLNSHLCLKLCHRQNIDLLLWKNITSWEQAVTVWNVLLTCFTHTPCEPSRAAAAEGIEGISAGAPTVTGATLTLVYVWNHVTGEMWVYHYSLCITSSTL